MSRRSLVRSRSRCARPRKPAPPDDGSQYYRHWLTALANPLDELALYSVLASPLAGLALDSVALIALHARELTFLHPIRCEPVTLLAPASADWAEWAPGEG